MNEKFFSLPEEKQQAILNAGYRVFSQNTYKNSPMSQIAEAAGISKSLLFHYNTDTALSFCGTPPANDFYLPASVALPTQSQDSSDHKYTD